MFLGAPFFHSENVKTSTPKKKTFSKAKVDFFQEITINKTSTKPSHEDTITNHLGGHPASCPPKRFFVVVVFFGGEV